MKHSRLIGVVAAFGLVVAACGGDDDAATTEPPPETPAPDDDAPEPEPDPDPEPDDDPDPDPDPDEPDQPDADPVDVVTGPGVTDTEIRTAVLNDFSGPIASIGTPAAIGSEIFFDWYNDEHGGVCGREVVAVRADTRYDTQEAIQQYRSINDDIAFITQLLGTGAVFALANDVASDNLTMLAGTLSAAAIPLPNTFVYQTPFPLEAINAMSWVADEYGTDGPVPVGIIYQNDAFGEEGLAAVELAEPEFDIEIVARASYSPTDEDFTAQVQAMIDGGAEVVWLHNTPRQTAGILGIAAQLGYEPVFISLSAGYATELAGPLGDLLGNFRVVNSNASIQDEGEEIERMAAAAAQYAPDESLDNWMVTGWISGRTTVAALERACEMGDLSRDGIIAAMDGLEVSMNGIAPDIAFGSTPDERIPSREVKVNEIDPDSGLPVPITDYFSTDLADGWTLPG
jgi:branched-chain amino acid transport system substrate-binding protein